MHFLRVNTVDQIDSARVIRLSHHTHTNLVFALQRFKQRANSVAASQDVRLQWKARQNVVIGLEFIAHARARNVDQRIQVESH